MPDWRTSSRLNSINWVYLHLHKTTISPLASAYVMLFIHYAQLRGTQEINGTNAYSVLASPRGPGTEAMVISASWFSRTGDGDGTLNLRGVATVLALASFLRRNISTGGEVQFLIDLQVIPCGRRTLFLLLVTGIWTVCTPG